MSLNTLQNSKTTDKRSLSFFLSSFHSKLIAALKNKNLITIFFHSRTLLDAHSKLIPSLVKDKDSVKSTRLKVLTVSKKAQEFLPFPPSSGVLAVTWCSISELENVKARIESEEGFVLAMWSGEDQAWKSFGAFEVYSTDNLLTKELVFFQFLSFFLLYFKKNI